MVPREYRVIVDGDCGMQGWTYGHWLLDRYQPRAWSTGAADAPSRFVEGDGSVEYNPWGEADTGTAG